MPQDAPSHPLLTGEAPVGIMTADAPRFPVMEQGGNEALKHRLNQAGLRYEETRGHYGGPESSLLVYGPSREQMKHLGKQFGQESVIYSEGPKREFIYTAGPNEGTYHEGQGHEHWKPEQGPPEDNWTELPGHGFVRLNFNFGEKKQPLTRHEVGHRLYAMLKRVDNETQSSMAGATVADERKLSLPEALEVLSKGLKEKVEKATKQMVELRKRELRKSEVGLCITCGELDAPEYCTCLKKAEAHGACPKCGNAYGECECKSVKKDEGDGYGENDASCPGCGKANSPMGALGKLKHYRCRNCGGMYSFDPFSDEGQGDGSKAPVGKPAQKTESTFASGSAPVDTGKGLGTGIPDMALSEVKKSVPGGMSPAAPPGVPAKPPSGGGMMMSEETKAHAGNAFAGDGDPDPSLVPVRKEEVKVKVKVKLPSSKKSMEKAEPGKPLPSGKEMKAKMAAYDNRIGDLNQRYRQSSNEDEKMELLHGIASTETQRDYHSEICPVCSKFVKPGDVQNHDFFQHKAELEPGKKEFKKGWGLEAAEGAPGKMAGAPAPKKISGGAPTPLGGAGGGGPSRGGGGRGAPVTLKAELTSEKKGTAMAIEEGREEPKSVLPGDKAPVVQGKKSQAGGNSVKKLGKVSPIWSPSKPGSKAPGLPGMPPRSGAGATGSLKPGDVLSFTSLASSPTAMPKMPGLGGAPGSMLSGGPPPMGAGTAQHKGTALGGAKPAGGLAAHKPAVAGATMKSEKDAGSKLLFKMDSCSLCRKAEHAGKCV